jgi:hypothetical protein
MKSYFCLLLVVFSLFSGCMSDGSETIVLPEKESSNIEGKIPQDVIPDEIRVRFENSMPINIGTAPPDISGRYLFNNLILVGSTLSNDSPYIGGYNGCGGKCADLYIAFIKGSNGKLSYKERSSGDSYKESDDVKIVGSGNNFTAYFVTTGVSNGISTKESTIISGTLTSAGISNFHYAFIMLEKGYDPNDENVVPINTYRVFKDGDGLAERYNWN